jgi:hypothetical protein
MSLSGNSKDLPSFNNEDKNGNVEPPSNTEMTCSGTETLKNEHEKSEIIEASNDAKGTDIAQLAKEDTECDAKSVNSHLVKIKLDDTLTGLANIEILAKHYQVPSILIKSLFGLNDKRTRNYLNNNNINNNVGSSGLGTDDVCKFILDLEAEIIDFIIKPSVDSWKMNPLNSYYRLLSHQLADYYHLGHILSNDGSSMVLFKINTSLINADDETKKNAKFDESGNIKPLNLRNLKFDPNEKLDRVKLADLFNSYKDFFIKYTKNHYDYNNINSNEQLAKHFQNLQLNANTNNLPTEIKNVRIMQRNINSSNLTDSDTKEQVFSSVSSSEFDISKEVRYKLAKERIQNENEEDGDEENDEIFVNTNEDTTTKQNGGQVRGEEEEEVNYGDEDDEDAQIIIGSSNNSTNLLDSYRPERPMYMNHDIRYKSHAYRRNDGGNKNYKKNKNYNYNNRYQYGYYPPNQIYTPNNPQNAPYGYIMPSTMNSMPIASSNTATSQPYYYVPIVSPPVNNNANLNGSTDVEEELNGEDKEQSEGRSEVNPMNNKDKETRYRISSQPSYQSATNQVPITYPMNIGQPPLIPASQFSVNGRPVYQYYYPPHGNQYYSVSGSNGTNMPPPSGGMYMPMMYYGDNMLDNNGYTNNDHKSRKYYMNGHGNMNHKNGNYGNYGYNNNNNNNNNRNSNNNRKMKYFGGKNDRYNYDSSKTASTEAVGESQDNNLQEKPSNVESNAKSQDENLQE